MQAFTICIIGGTSKFWQFWKQYFLERWQVVIIASRSTAITPSQAVQMADIIIFSLSIRHTVSTIRELVPLIPPGRLVMDFTGIKTEATEELRKYTHGEVIAAHPMFGSWIKNLKDQNIAFDPIFPGKKWDYMKHLWQTDGANLIELSSRDHDELVAVVQSSVHFVNLLLGHILKKQGIHLADFIKISTPNSRMQLMILGRFLNQEASLYSDMQIYNSIYKNEILPEIKNYTAFLEDIIHNEKSSHFEQEFDSIKTYMGQDLLDKALSISSKFDQETKEGLS